MMTGREARQRAEIHQGTLFRTPNGVYKVYLNEWDAKERREYSRSTDDLETAVIMLGNMRHSAKDICHARKR